MKPQTASGAPSVLLVDDDPGLQQSISSYLSEHGYRINVAGDGRAMDRVIRDANPDLIILDLMLPGEDGLTICKRLNRPGRPAVIIASAAGDESDRVIGLELGADDYLPKPFSPRELLARVRAVLRRPEDKVESRAEPAREVRVDGLVYEPLTRRLVSPSGVRVMLTGSESALLNYLLSRPGQVVRRASLGAIRGDAEFHHASGRQLDVMVSRLRRKLAHHGCEDIIETVYGVGYVLKSNICHGET